MDESRDHYMASSRTSGRWTNVASGRGGMLLVLLFTIFLAAGVLNVLVAIGSAILAGGFSMPETNYLFPGVVNTIPLVAGVSIYTLVVGVLALVAAYGLYALARWSWGLAVATAILGLVIVPFGLLGGIVSLVLLSLPDVRAPFRALSPRRAGTARAT